jgi:hypothetical protein
MNRPGVIGRNRLLLLATGFVVGDGNGDRFADHKAIAVRSPC